MYKIGIGVTTRNRNEIVKTSLENIYKYLPEGAKVVLVDDASTIPVKGADYRFEVNAGIPKAKNKCFELLGDQDFYFLFDDDCYPIKQGWDKQYIEAYERTGSNHFCFTSDFLRNGVGNGNKRQSKIGDLISYSNPCGCMLFFTKKCLDTVGGFDTAYGKYGYEHVDLSCRIFNNGLTPARYVDIPNSLEYFHSLDHECAISSTVKARLVHIQLNQTLFAKNYKSTQYKPYKALKNIIITTYLTGKKDPQRGYKWHPEPNKLKPLLRSCKNEHVVLIHDCFEDQIEGVEMVKIETKHNPYFQRWISTLEYLEKSDADQVFCVDSTDVELLKSPFREIEDKLYVGDEWGKRLTCEWMQSKRSVINLPDYDQLMEENKYKPLLNTGIIGGKKELVKEFFRKMCEYERINGDSENYVDMPIFNYVAYKFFKDKTYHGSNVNTKFKQEENAIRLKNRPGCPWFKHK